MKSKIILANSKDPRYIDLKKLIDNSKVWQTLDFECVISKREKMNEIDIIDTYFPLSISTTTYENITYNYCSLNKNLDDMIKNLIKWYQGEKIFVWSMNLEKRIFKLLIKHTNNKFHKNILRIMMYNIIDLQTIFEGNDPLIMINNQIKSASLSNWSDFFEINKTPIESKDISLNGYSIMKQLKNKSIDENSKVVKQFLKKVSIHNDIDTKTIYKIFIMIKHDKSKMIFLNELENKSLKI